MTKTHATSPSDPRYTRCSQAIVFNGEALRIDDAAPTCAHCARSRAADIALADYDRRTPPARGAYSDAELIAQRAALIERATNAQAEFDRVAALGGRVNAGEKLRRLAARDAARDLFGKVDDIEREIERRREAQAPKVNVLRPTTHKLTVRGIPVTTRTPRRYIVVKVRPEPYTTEAGTYVAFAEVVKRTDSLDAARREERRDNSATFRYFTVVIDTATGDEI